MTEESDSRTIHQNVYKIGDVITAMAFASVLLFLAYLLGYGMGISRGADEGKAEVLQHILDKKP